MLRKLHVKHDQMRNTINFKIHQKTNKYKRTN